MEEKKIPYLKNENGIYELIIDGKAFTALAGEVHNSSASNLLYMEECVWPYIKNLHLNTLIVPIYWESIESIEGTFDFTLVEGIIKQARQEGVKLILLWFGLWKNGMSSYVPQWIKKQQTKYFRVRDVRGSAMDVISPLCDNAVEADSKAFSELMKFIKLFDSKDQTVIMMQVENEMGLLGSDRDYSEFAQKEFQCHIPSVISKIYKTTGTWTQAFGEEAPEVFMEYYYSTAIEKIASAGKIQYGLPMYVNAWIEKFPWRPGGYPSGGPIARFLPLWKQIAPSISALAPDIYSSDFVGVCNEYAKEGNPLIIPEVRRDVRNVSNVFYAIGKYRALCYSPFGIEDFLTPKELLSGLSDPMVLKTLNIDVTAFSCENTAPYLSKSYEIIGQMLPAIHTYEKFGKVHSFLRSNEHERGCVISLKEFDLRIDYKDQNEKSPKAAGIIIEIANNEFYIAGTSFTYTLLRKKNEYGSIGYLQLEEGSFINENWTSQRVLNGDERYFTNMYEMPAIHRAVVYRYE